MEDSDDDFDDFEDENSLFDANKVVLLKNQEQLKLDDNQLLSILKVFILFF